MGTTFKINLSKYPRVFNVDTPFWEDLYKHYSGERQGMNRGEYNLICSKRDISLWTKLKMKPNRHWKVTDAKKYFNISGVGEALLNDFMEVWSEYQELKKEMKKGHKSGKQIELLTKIMER